MRLSSAKIGFERNAATQGARPPKGARVSLPALSAKREPSFPTQTTSPRTEPRNAWSADVPSALSAQRELASLECGNLLPLSHAATKIPKPGGDKSPLTKA